MHEGLLPILYLDNLVRLSVHSDPDPGKNRTSQICTLPITVKGLPKDSIITKSWHLDECEMDENCSCKNQLILGKDHHELLLEYTDSEEKITTHLRCTDELRYWLTNI